MSNIDHPFIVAMEIFTQDFRYLYLVMEFISGGEFFTYLRSVGKLKTNYACFYAA